MVRDIKVKAVFEKIKGEISEPLEEGTPQKSAAIRDDAIQEIGLCLPDDPKERDPKKRTCKREIKFSDYHVDLSKRIGFLFTEFYNEIDSELDKMKKMISNKKCQKKRCRTKNCSLKYK